MARSWHFDHVDPEPRSAGEVGLARWYTTARHNRALPAAAFPLRQGISVTTPQRYYEWIDRALERPLVGCAKVSLFRQLAELRGVACARPRAPRREQVQE